MLILFDHKLNHLNNAGCSNTGCTNGIGLLSDHSVHVIIDHEPPVKFL